LAFASGLRIRPPPRNDACHGTSDRLQRHTDLPCVLAGKLGWKVNASFANNYVHDQLAQQQITFKTATYLGQTVLYGDGQGGGNDGADGIEYVRCGHD
jgi:hypothetical protein